MNAKTILWVDDEDWSIQSYFTKMEDFGIENHLALTVEMAVRRIRESRYDLIVSDLFLPQGSLERLLPKSFLSFDMESSRYSGLVLLKIIRDIEFNRACSSKTEFDVPFIIITAATEKKTQDKCSSLGVTDLFQKPVSFDLITNRILDILEVKN